MYLPLLLLTCGAIMAMDRADPDLWGHIQYGREVLCDAALPATSTWNYTAPGYRWINHENFAELAMAAAYDLFGTWGLSIGKFLMSLLVIGLLVRDGQRRGGNSVESAPSPGRDRLLQGHFFPSPSGAVHPITTAFVALVLAIGIEFHWHFRPQIFGYACAAAMMACLSRSLRWQWQEGGQPGPSIDQSPPGESSAHRPLRWRLHVAPSLWLVVPLIWIWTNSHGSFLAGLCVLWCYFALLSAQLLASCGREALREVMILGGVAAGAAVATVANPYGIRLHLWLWEALHVPRPEIWDWQPLELTSREAVSFWAILLTTAAAAWMTYVSKARREISPVDRLDWPKLVVLTLVGAQALLHVRHLPLLAIVWSFWIQRPLNRFWQPIRLDVAERLAQARQKAAHHDQNLTPQAGHGQSATKGAPSARARFSLGAPAVSALLASLWAGYLGWELGGQLSAIKVDRDLYPVQAMAFLARHNLEGRTVVTFNWAQYAIGVFADEGLASTVAVDGRFRTCYPQEVIDTQFDFLFGEDYTGPRYRSPQSPPVDPERALRSGRPELVLISRKQRSSVRTMQSLRDEWSLLYQDGTAQVWGRREIFDDPASPRFLPHEHRIFSDRIARGWVEWPAFPEPSSGDSVIVESAESASLTPLADAD